MPEHRGQNIGQRDADHEKKGQTVIHLMIMDWLARTTLSQINHRPAHKKREGASTNRRVLLCQRHSAARRGTVVLTVRYVFCKVAPSRGLPPLNKLWTPGEPRPPRPPDALGRGFLYDKRHPVLKYYGSQCLAFLRGQIAMRWRWPTD
jgi:hypothetical protein